MSGFNLRVTFKGMIAFVPNHQYNEMIALVLDTGARGHSHHSAGHSEERGESGSLVTHHLPHHPRLVFNCADVVGCPENQVLGIMPHPDRDTRPGFSDKMILPLAGHDLSFLLPERTKLGRNELSLEGIEGASSVMEELPPDDPEVEPDDLSMRRLINISRLVKSSGRDFTGEVEPALVKAQLGDDFKNLLAARLLLTSGHAQVGGYDGWGLWRFRPNERVPSVFERWMPIEIDWDLGVSASSIKMVMEPFRAEGSLHVLEFSPRAGNAAVEVWLENEPTVEDWMSYEMSFREGRPIPRDEHFKMYYQLCRDFPGLSVSDLPIPHRAAPLLVEPPSGDNPIICPKPGFAASREVGSV